MESARTRYAFKERSRRTNSLAFAKNDCHTCTALKKNCDRQRPRCGTCLSNGIMCHGFSMPLVWKGSGIHVPTPPHGEDARPSSQQKDESRRNAEFKFVQGRPKKRRKPKMNGSHKVDLSQGCFSVALPSLVEATYGRPSPSSSPDHCEHISSPLPDPLIRDAVGDGAWPAQSGVVGASIGTWLPPHQLNYLPDTDWNEPDLVQATSSNLTISKIVEEVERYNFEEFVLYRTILYQDLAQKYSNILEMYNNDFCVMPLTHDYHANPFRVRLDRIQEFPSLLHVVMALSSQHLAKISNSTSMVLEMQNHKSTAIQLFSEALNSPNSEPLLDTLLLLIIFEITQSAHGMWSVHLNGAKSLLEQLGAGEGIKTNIRMRGQVGMLVWWDVTIALISRREPILPMSYLEMLVQFPEDDSWSFFALAGCPIQFLMAMAHLAKLASIYEKTTKMEWTMFNNLPVQLIVEEVNGFINVEAVNFSDLETLEYEPEARRNRFHCVEAWRHAILLFTARAFCQKQDAYGIRKITHLARIVLDCVRCIPTTEFFQKQLLLPVFLAGAENGSEMDRMFVRQYFQHWNETTRFEHFGSAGELLEVIWKDWDVSTRDVYWWGTKIKHQTVRRANSMISEALLG